jgi:tRNA1(Val) A37 N6-methylase TrmN6
MNRAARRGASPQPADAGAQLTLGFDQRPFDIAVIHQATGIYTAAGEIGALLARLHWPAEGDRLLDPGGGNGGILVEALRRLDLDRDDVAAAARRVRGIEFYPGAVAEARRAVRDHLDGRGWSAPAAERAALTIVEERDFLLSPVPAGVFDLIVMNPPYMRLANLPDGYRADYEASVAAHARGDMLYAYLQQAADILAAGGRIGLISADRWLLNNGSAELRRRLGQVFRVTDLCRLDAESAFYSAKDRRQGTPPRVHAVSLILTSDDGGRPLDASPFRLANLPDVDGTPLGDIADIEIRLAPWLGPAGIFLVSKADKIPAFEVDSTGTCTARLVPAVEPRDIDGDTIRPARRWALVTTEAEPPAVILEHLDATLHRMPARGRRTVRRWLPPETFTGRLPLDHDAVLVPRIALRLKAVVLPAGRLPVNHQLVVVSGRPAAVIIGMLSDPAVQAQAEALALRVEGGYRSYTASLLRRLVIPRPYLTAGRARPS